MIYRRGMGFAAVWTTDAMLAGAASKKVLPGKSACGRRAASKGKAVGGAGLNRFHVRAAAAPGGDERSGVMSRVRAVFTRTNAIAAHREGSSTLLDGAQTTVGGLAAGERKLADATRQRANEKVRAVADILSPQSVTLPPFFPSWPISFF